MYKWPSCPFAKVIPPWVNHFGKRTVYYEVPVPSYFNKASSYKLKILLKRLLKYRNLYLCNSLDRHNVPMTGVERYDTSSATWNYSLTHLAPISCDQPAGQPIGLIGWPAARRTGWSVKDQKTPQKPTFAFEFYRCTLCLLAQWSIQKKFIRKT